MPQDLWAKARAKDIARRVKHSTEPKVVDVDRYPRDLYPWLYAPAKSRKKKPRGAENPKCACGNNCRVGTTMCGRCKRQLGVN